MNKLIYFYFLLLSFSLSATTEPPTIQKYVDFKISQAHKAKSRNSKTPIPEVINFDSYEQEQLSNHDLIKHGVIMNIPDIGDVILNLDGDPSKPMLKYGLLNPIDFTPVPLKINTLEVIINNAKDVSATAQANIFGKEAILKLSAARKESNLYLKSRFAETATPDGPVSSSENKKLYLGTSLANFKVTFVDPVSVTILPGITTQLQQADLILEKGQAPIISSKITLYNQSVYFDFILNKNNTLLMFELPQATLGNISQFSASTLKKIELKKIFFNTEDAFKEDTHNMTVHITGEADFSPLFNPSLSNFVKTVKINGAVTQNSFHLEGIIDLIKLPILGSIHRAKLILDSDNSDTTKKNISPTLLLKGEGKSDAPDIGEFNYQLASTYIQNRFVFTGTVKPQITYKSVKILDPIFKLDLQQNKLNITGKITNYDLDIQAHLSISPDSTQKNKKHVRFNLQTKKKDWQPFKNTNDPLLENITITEIKAGFVKTEDHLKQAQEAFYITGKSKILNKDIDPVIQFITNKDQEGILLKAKLSHRWKLSQSIPKAKGTKLNELKYERVNLVATDIDYHDPKMNILYQKGLNISANAKIRGPLAPIKKLFGDIHTIVLSGKLEQDPATINWKAQLDKTISFKTKLLAAGPLTAHVTSKEAYLKTNIILTPSKKDQLLTIEGNIYLDQNGCRFISTSSPTWQNPFGIAGLSIEEPKLEFALDYTAFEATKLPSKLTLTGNLQLGEHKIELKSTCDKFYARCIMSGKLAQISFADALKYLATPQGIKIPDTIPVEPLKNIEITLSPKTIKSQDITAQKGIFIKSEFEILDKKIPLNLTINSRGVTSQTPLETINIGPLRIGSKKNNPNLDIIFNDNQQKFVISGIFSIKNLFKTAGELIITKNGLNFDLDTKISKQLFDAQVSGYSKSINQPDFIINIIMKQKFIKYIEKIIADMLLNAEKDLKIKIEDTEFALSTISEQLQVIESDIDSTKKMVQKAQEAQTSQTQEPSDTKKPQTNEPESPESVEKWQDTLDTLLKNKDKLLTDQENNKNILDSAEKSGLIFRQDKKYFVKNFTEQFAINSISFEGDLKKISAGTIPDMIFDMVILGQEKKISHSFNFNRIDESAKELAEFITNFNQITN